MAVSAVAAGAVFLRYQNEVGRARDAARRGSALIDTEAGPIEYAEAGAGVPLLSIHGAGGGFDQGLSLAAEFVSDGFRIIAPSRFGYLRTPVPPDDSPAAQADAHAALLSKLNVPKAIVVGVSAGARSAIELAIRRPDMSLPLSWSFRAPIRRPVQFPWTRVRGSKFALWAVKAGGDFAWWAIEKIAPSILVRFMGVRPELVAAAAQHERNRVINLVRGVEPLSLRFRGINVDSTPHLGELPLDKISAPTLIVSARDDLFNTLPAAEFAANKIPGAKLVVYDSGGHLLIERERNVRATIRDFLGAEVTSPTGAAFG